MVCAKCVMRDASAGQLLSCGLEQNLEREEAPLPCLQLRGDGQGVKIASEHWSYPRLRGALISDKQYDMTPDDGEQSPEVSQVSDRPDRSGLRQAPTFSCSSQLP